MSITTIDQTNLCVQARECLANFELLAAVQPDSSNCRNSEDHDGEEQKARFLIWSANIGVFADGHASLDYRLRNNLEVSKIMFDLLASLSDNIYRATHSFQVNNDDGPQQDAITGSEGSISNDEFGGVPSSSIISSLYSATDDSLSISVDQDRTPFEQRLYSVEKTIDRLYRLSIAIRQPSMSNQNEKATLFVIKDEDGNDVDAEFGNFALTYINHQFPNAAREIRERLARSIALRRKRFLYRQSHQKKLSHDPYFASRPLANPRLSGMDIESTVVVRTVVAKSTDSHHESKQRSLLGPMLKSQTSASQFPEKIKIQQGDIYEDTPSGVHSLFSGAIGQEASISIPKPPKLVPGSKEFECPYCCMMLPIKEATSTHWKRHVLNDIEPYVCVFEGCIDEYGLFRDRASWISHMKGSHTKQWTCVAAGHMSCIFETEDTFESHMRLDHTTSFKDSQLAWYKKRSQGPSDVLFTSCPLCGNVPTEDDILKEAAVKGVNHHQQYQRGVVVSEVIARCVTSHMQTLSLMALPWQEDIEEEVVSENEKSSHVDEGDQTGDERSSILLDDTNKSLQFDDDPWHMEIGELKTDRFPKAATDHHPQSLEIAEEEWGFIARPEYYGHDRDPILQRLLRKLYLDSSSATDRRTNLILPVYMMPPAPLNDHFFGRDYALHAIETHLCPKTIPESTNSKAITYPLTFALCAPGGMGKTQVATQFVLTHLEDFDAIFWVNAASRNEIDQGFRRIALLLDLIPEDSPNANDLRYTRDIVKRWLVNPKCSYNNGRKKSTKMITWLLIYDGVQNPDDLNEFWPYDGPGSVLITSRNPFSWAKSLPLKPFTSQEAIDFLLKLTGRDMSDVDGDSLTKLSARLGGLPLALTQMGSIIMQKKLDFSQFLDAYNERESQRELLQFQTELNSQSYEHTIASVWALENLKHGRNLLNVLSMIDPDGIPEQLLTSAMVYTDFPGYPTTIKEYHHAKGELLACSLVTGNKQEHKLFIHRLVQDVARARMDQVELRLTFIACVKLVAAIWPFETFAWRHGVERWPACEGLLTHIARLKDLFPVSISVSDASNEYLFARLLTDAGWYLHERGRPIDSNLFNNMARSICESLRYDLDGKDSELAVHVITHADLDSTLAELYHNQGCISSEANDAIGAMENFKMFHNMMEEELGKEIQRTDMRLGLACNELGNAYMLQDDWVRGEKFFQRSIDLLRQLDHFEPILISLPLVNLGYAFWLQGRLDEAATVLLQGVEAREAKYGVHDRVSFISGRFYHALGNVRYDQGATEDSLNYHHKALLHYKSTLGNNHHRTASVFVKVAEHNIRNHQYDTAIALLDHALKAFELSSNHLPDKTRASFKRFRALQELSNTADAEKELSKCFQLYPQLIKEKSKLTGQHISPKLRAEDLTDEDFDDMVAFWSR